MDGNIYIVNGKDHLGILNNINLEIKSGDSIYITGKSGSGKSTLFNILCNRMKSNSDGKNIGVFYGTDKGKVNLNNISNYQLFDNILLCNQQVPLWSQSLGFNICGDKEISVERLPFILKKYPNLSIILNNYINEYIINNNIVSQQQSILKSNIFANNPLTKKVLQEFVQDKTFKNELCIEILKELDVYNVFLRKAIIEYMNTNNIPHNKYDEIKNLIHDNQYKNIIHDLIINNIILENRGANLSGGQRQMIALSHIIYLLLVKKLEKLEQQEKQLEKQLTL
jgi:ABC-type lipoprotein export system ATPase subunit